MLENTPYTTLTHDNFQSEVLEAEALVLIDCWASWCGSFQQINFIYNELAVEFSSQIKVARLNVATSEKLATYYGIRVVPTLLLLKHGQVLERVIGNLSKQDLASRLSTLLHNNDSSRRQLACL